MCGLWFKRGRRRTFRRSAAALAILATAGVLGALIPADGDRFYSGLVIGEASAKSKIKPNKGSHYQKVQQAAQQLQRFQQTAATQSKLRQFQTIVAAQQKHLQSVQKLVAAHKQKLSPASQPPTTPPPAAQPPKIAGGHHQAIIQKALAQVRAAKSTTSVPTAHKVKALIAKVVKSQTAQKAHPGQHHHALIKAAHQHTKQQKILAPASGKQQSTSQLVYQHIAAKLKGHGHGFGGPHIGKHKAVFQHIVAKLSAAKSKQRAAPPAATPAPTTPTTITTSTTKVTTSVAQAILPTLTQPTTGTTVVAAVASAVKGNAGNENGEQATSSNLLGSTISKLGGPKQPDTSSGSGGSGRTANKNGDNDDDSKDGGIVSALRNGTKPNPNRSGAAGGLHPLASVPTIGTYVPKQVLAVSLSPQGLKKVLELKFKVKKTYKLALLGVTITKLEAPTQDGALPSLDKLEEAISDSAFALNRVYVPYRLGASGGGIARERPLGFQTGCDPDRCFGASLINWRPQLSSCAQNVKIGIIDTGIDEEHPAIKGGPYEYKEFVPSDKARASQDHGTGVYSLLAGRPESSTPGLAPRATYRVANAFYAETKGGPAMSETVHMLAALDWLDDQGVQIINLSFSGPRDPLVHRAIKRLERKGVIVVAAAGNDGPSAPPSFPAAYEEVVAVTAVDRNLAPYRYANRGDHISIAAPGVGIWTALANRREGAQTGTSFAAPHVTGVLALNHSVIESMDASLSPKQRALQVLSSNAMKLGGPQDRRVFGAGLVRAPDACPSQDGTAIAKSTPATPQDPVVMKASSAPPLLDWLKATTVRAATGK